MLSRERKLTISDTLRLLNTSNTKVHGRLSVSRVVVIIVAVEDLAGEGRRKNSVVPVELCPLIKAIRLMTRTSTIRVKNVVGTKDSLLVVRIR